MNFTRESFSTAEGFEGIPLELSVGYSRMIKIGNYVRIGGTAAVELDGSVHAPDDVYKQTKFIMERFLRLLERAGATPADVHGIRAFTVNDVNDDFGRAYSEYFKKYRPIATAIGVDNLGPGLRIEIECEAFIGSGRGDHSLRRLSYASGVPLEEKVGYSRMIKIGNYIRIGGTGPANPDGSIYAPNDAYAQTKFILNRFIDFLGQAGASLADVYAIRCFARNDPDDGFGKAYSEIFKVYRPIATKIGISNLFSPDMLVEIECEAYIGSGDQLKL